jgi:formamidopyrimidine-DNA glycosylase
MTAGAALRAGRSAASALASLRANVAAGRTSRDSGGEPVPEGADVRGERFDAGLAVARARSRQDAEVGELLLAADVAGQIGNRHRCDAMWALGLDPTAPVSTLGDLELRRLYLTVRDLAHVHAGGRPAQRVAVHRRAGEACPRCSLGITVFMQAGRRTYTCSGCQRPAPETVLSGTVGLRGVRPAS